MRRWPSWLVEALAAAVVRHHGRGDAEPASELAKRKPDQDEGKNMVEHVRVKVAKPFDAVSAALWGLGKFHPAVYDQLRKGDDPEAVRARIEGMAGPSGFMLFRTSDHGALLRLVGQQRKAVQYLVGNPLFAVEMTRHAIEAALYAPLRVLIYEDG